MQATPLAANEKIIEADFKVTYNTDNPPSVKDVIKSLSSLEYLIQKGVLVLEAAYPDIKIVSRPLAKVAEGIKIRRHS